MKIKEVGIKILVELSRTLLGVTFIFSGFVKAVDPFGFAYKIEDYFAAFNLTSLSFLALPISAFMCVLEFAMGAFMLFGIYRKWNSRLMLLVMIFMTSLTLYLAIANPVEDCGCFGDALIITNWQTFYKNIVLLICSIIIFIYRERISNFFTGKTYWLAFLYILFFISLFVFRNYVYDPLFDFRPYKIGANIPELMSVEEGKGREDKSYFIYAKDGVEKEFTEDNYPWQDSTWVFVRMDTKVIKEGEKPVIKDFVIEKLIFDKNKKQVVDRSDITNDVLSDTNYVFLMISPSLDKMNSTYLSKFEDIDHYAKDYGYSFYCLTSSVTDDILSWKQENASNFDFCTTDERTLKTIIRSNPGLILIKNGIVINKWAGIEVPSEEDLTNPLDKLAFGNIINLKEENNKNIIAACLIFLIPLLALKGFDVLFFRKMKKDNSIDRKEEENQ